MEAFAPEAVKRRQGEKDSSDNHKAKKWRTLMCRSPDLQVSPRMCRTNTGIGRGERASERLVSAWPSAVDGNGRIV